MDTGKSNAQQNQDANWTLTKINKNNNETSKTTTKKSRGSVLCTEKAVVLKVDDGPLGSRPFSFSCLLFLCNEKLSIFYTHIFALWSDNPS